MTATEKSSAAVAGARSTSRHVRHRLGYRSGIALGALVLAGAAGCKDSNVPFYTAPTSISNTPDGVQNAITGLFESTRQDVGNDIYYLTMFARDEANIQEDNPENVIDGTGIAAIPSSSDNVWDNEYLSVGAAINIISVLPTIAPAYTAQQAAAISGVAQTMEALNLMIVAESRDTLGIPVHAAAGGGPGPVYCNKDVWQQIVTELDSANRSLTTAGPIALPVKLPTGFSSVSVTAGPSTTAGSFASFNRALAAKAGLEYAYAIARNSPATHPTPTTPGSPDVGALTRADSAATASALYNVASLAPPVPGGWTDNSSGVYWDWSAQAGDVVNPLNQGEGVWVTLKTLAADIDTVNDARWKAKFDSNTFKLQLTQYDSVTTRDLYDYYPATSTPIPLIRTEGLVLIRAQIQLGLGNFATATTLINDVHMNVGGFTSPLTIAPTYTAVRDSLMKEQRISTVFEGSNDRVIAIRMYHLEAVADTTWGAADLHTTVIPVVAAEIEGRGGSYTITCP